MSGSSWRGRGEASYRSIAGLLGLLAGCAARPTGEPGGTPGTAAQAVVLRPGAAGDLVGGRYPGLSRRMTFIGLADLTSSLSRDPSPFRFSDIRAVSGIDFVH